MNSIRAGQFLLDCLSITLVCRLLQLRLHSVYRVFCFFLLFEVLASVIFFAEEYLHDPRLDYRITWIVIEIMGWCLSLWTIFALLRALLARLPGILRFSRRVLAGVTALCIALALISARPEMSSGGLVRPSDPVSKIMGSVILTDRLIATVVVLVLLAISVFVLWFPIRLPRNLAVFTIGFVIYFGSKTALLLVPSFWRHPLPPVIGIINTFLLSCALAYWLLNIRANGEKSTVTLGHRWRSQDQDRLLLQLQTLNETLVRATGHKPTPATSYR